MAHQANVNDVEGIRQVEFKAGLGKALRHSGQSEFSLLLAMMQQDVTQRLKLIDKDAQSPSNQQTPPELQSLYPNIPLKTSLNHVDEQYQLAKAVEQNDIARMKLLAYMRPTPLSLYNDAKRVDDDVVANCDLFTQSKLKQVQQPDITVDPTMMYDAVKKVRDLGLHQ